MRNLLFRPCLSVLAIALFGCAAARATQPALMPWPSQIDFKSGVLALGHPLRASVTGCDDRVSHAIDRFRQQLAVLTGDQLNHQSPDAKENPPLEIHCAAKGLPVQAVEEDESYTLSISQDGVKIDAPTPLGAMHGLQSMVQLAEWGPWGWQLPVVEIHDTPRFAWRGLMLDVSRHFMPFDQVLRQIDAMERVKLNVLHMHLSDDEGFRVESKKYPHLQQAASEGMFYTQAELRQMVSYARERGIRVVPEFDVPGHSTDWITAYPELASSEPGSHVVRNQTDENRPPLDPTNEKVYKILDDVFGEMTALFPDAYFHIGGDEVDPKYWDHSEHVQAFMKAHDLKDAAALQNYFNKRLLPIVTKHGKHMIGWDEVLVPGLPIETVIHSWRGPKSLAVAAKAGYSTILSAGYYIDLMQPASEHYLVDPMSGDAASLTPEQAKHVLGGEAAMWAEYVNPENVDNRIWPRTAAIAERFWSPASVRDVDSMYDRLDRVSTQLEFLGLTHRSSQQRMLARLIGPAPKAAVMTLAETLEPVKLYERGNTHQFDADYPLILFNDALSPESDAARHVNKLIDRVLANPTDASPCLELRRTFERWRENDAQLQPWFSTSSGLKSIAEFSPVLAKLGSDGLRALDAMGGGPAIGAGEHADHLAAAKAAEVHRAMLLVAVAPGMRKLIEAEKIAQ